VHPAARRLAASCKGITTFDTAPPYPARRLAVKHGPAMGRPILEFVLLDELLIS
jgi:hypothetical protein